MTPSPKTLKSTLVLIYALKASLFSLQFYNSPLFPITLFLSSVFFCFLFSSPRLKGWRSDCNHSNNKTKLTSFLNHGWFTLTKQRNVTYRYKKIRNKQSHRNICYLHLYAHSSLEIPNV